MQITIPINKARHYFRAARRPAVRQVHTLIGSQLTACTWRDTSITIEVDLETAKKFVEKAVRPHHFRDGTTLKDIFVAAIQREQSDGEPVDQAIDDHAGEATVAGDNQTDQDSADDDIIDGEEGDAEDSEPVGLIGEPVDDQNEAGPVGATSNGEQEFVGSTGPVTSDTASEASATDTAVDADETTSQAVHTSPA